MSKIQVTNINDLSDNAALVTQNGGIKTDKLTGKTTAGSILVTGEGNSTTTNLQQGLAKSWNNINGSFTIEDSFNVASCVDESGNAPNTYTINMTNAMSNTTYMAFGTAETSGQAPRSIGISSPATGSYFVSCCVSNSPSSGTSVIGNTAVLGDLA